MTPLSNEGFSQLVQVLPVPVLSPGEAVLVLMPITVLEKGIPATTATSEFEFEFEFESACL
jgi:hypothetical protein